MEILSAHSPLLQPKSYRAIRFFALNEICKALHCQPGDILEYEPDEEIENPE